MTIETTLVKRAALYPQEIGFFPSNPMAQEDVTPITMGSEVMVTLRSERNLQALKFLWALVHKTAENTDCFLDKDDCMERLKVRIGYSKAVYDPHTREMAVRGKSLKKISDEALRVLTDRMMDVICSELMPGMKRNELRREIEEMIGGNLKTDVSEED